MGHMHTLMWIGIPVVFILQYILYIEKETIILSTIFNDLACFVAGKVFSSTQQIANPYIFGFQLCTTPFPSYHRNIDIYAKAV